MCIQNMARTLLLALLLSTGLSAQTAYEVARMVTDQEMPEDMVMDMAMTLTARTGHTRTMTVRSVRKGDERQITWFLAPPDDRGIAFLKIEYEDREDEMRMWLPAFGRMRRISSSQKGESFMGSDLTYEDMTSRALDEYTYTLQDEENIEGVEHWVLESIPKPELNSTYSRIVSWVRQSDTFVPREEFYDRAGNLLKVRTMDSDELKGYTVPVRMFVENLQTNHSTELLFQNIEVDTGVEDDLFHERNLRRLP